MNILNWIGWKSHFSTNMEEAATTAAANKNHYGNCYAVAVGVQNSAVVKVPLSPLYLPVGMTYVGETTAKIVSTAPVAKIVGVQTSNLSIFHYGKASSTVQT